MLTARLQDAARPEAPLNHDPDRALALTRVRVDGRVPSWCCILVGVLIGFATVQALAWLIASSGLAAALALPETFLAYIATHLAGASGAIAGLIWRDVLVRRALARPFGEPRCPRCRHSLRGLPIAGAAARCPECGHVHELAGLGLRASDLEPTPGTPAQAA